MLNNSANIYGDPSINVGTIRRLEVLQTSSSPGRLEGQRLDAASTVNAENKPAGVIITVYDGTQFNTRKVEQRNSYGKVAVYEVTPGKILDNIRRILAGDLTANQIETYPMYREEEGMEVNVRRNEEIRQGLLQLRSDLNGLHPMSFCLNFENCDGFDEKLANNERVLKNIIELVTYVVKDYGGLCIFSNKSLAAFINKWSVDSSLVNQIGVCPFVSIIKEYTKPLHLSYEPKTLINCPLARLQALGKLSTPSNNGLVKLEIKRGPATVFALTEAAAATMNPSETNAEEEEETPPYKVEVLSAATHFPDTTKNNINREFEANNQAAYCTVGTETGLCGHVLLEYPTSELYDYEDSFRHVEKPKGRLLATCLDWNKLRSLECNPETVHEVLKEDLPEDSAEYENVIKMMDDQRGDTRKKEAEKAALEHIKSAFLASEYKRLD